MTASNSKGTALITGASSDIGLALIRLLAAGPEPLKILAHCHSSAARIEAMRDQLGAGDSLVPIPKSPTAYRSIPLNSCQNTGMSISFVPSQ